MDNKRINIETLIDGYNKRTSDKLKDEYLKSQVKVTQYIDYGIKMLLAENIINNSCYKDNVLNIDSCKKYILYIYAIIKHWTNIDIDEKKLITHYDLLNKNELIEKILLLVPEKELSEFGTILEMKENDLITNECNLHVLINKRITKYSPKIFSALEALLLVLENKMNEVNISKLDNIIERLKNK